VWLGLISYPLYLWHWPLLSFARIVGGDPSSAARAGIAAVSVVLAAATYLLVERPIRFRPATTGMIASLGALMTIAGGVGVATFASRGIPGRLPAGVLQIAGFTYPPNSGSRGHRCLLYPDLGEHVFAPECFDSAAASASLPEIMLWGDSHAAQLYPGFVARHSQAFRISQVTIGGCPPLFGVAGAWANCGALTTASFAAIAARTPAIVVIAAEWVNYDWQALTGSVRRLRTAGVRKIVVVGEVPVWDGRFPEILARAVLKDRPAFRVPERTATRLLPQIVDLDRAMARLVRDSGVGYESTFDILCDGTGCLTRVNGEPTTFDESHLTPAASRYVVARFHSIP
jgi:hypothetical protein